MWTVTEVTSAAGTRVVAGVTGAPGRPSVVLVHGHSSSHRYLARLAGALRADARVAAPDLPGFGATPADGRVLAVPDLADALADWLLATGREGSVLLGHSIGCQVVLDLAARRPSLVGPLVLVAPTVDPANRSWPRQAARLALDLVREARGLRSVQVVDALRTGPRRFVRTFSSALDHDVEDLLPHVAVPAVVVRGQHDPLVPGGWARRVVDGLPDARLVELDGPHAVQWSRPDAVARVVRDVLAARAREAPVAG